MCTRIRRPEFRALAPLCSNQRQAAMTCASRSSRSTGMGNPLFGILPQSRAVRSGLELAIAALSLRKRSSPNAHRAITSNAALRARTASHGNSGFATSFPSPFKGPMEFVDLQLGLACCAIWSMQFLACPAPLPAIAGPRISEMVGEQASNPAALSVCERALRIFFSYSSFDLVAALL